MTGKCELVSKYNASNTSTQSTSLCVSSSVGLSQTCHAWWCKGDVNRAQNVVLDCEGTKCRKEVVTPMHNLYTIQWMSI